MHQQQTAFENIVGKCEIARYKQFLLFPQCFKVSQIALSPFFHIFDIMSLFAVDLEEPKIGISANGLTCFQGYRRHINICPCIVENKFPWTLLIKVWKLFIQLQKKKTSL